jgi:molybdopterin synthase sulfur carrier subunit
MKVNVKLFASLQRDRFIVGSYNGSATLTVRDVLASLKIPEEEAAIIFVNGRDRDVDAVIRDGDTLAVFPPVGGG